MCGFLLKVSCDFLYPSLSSLGASGLACDHSLLNLRGAVGFSVVGLFVVVMMENWLSSSFNARPDTGLLFLWRKWCLSDIFWSGVEFSENVYILVTVTIILPLKNKKTLVWLCWVLVATLRVFSCGMWDLVPWPGREPRPPALEAWSLNHWAAREVASFQFLIVSDYSYCFSKYFLAVKI